MSDDDKKHVSLAQAIKGLTDNWAAQVEFARLRAKLMRVRYQALVAEGFTEAQALELCKEV